VLEGLDSFARQTDGAAYATVAVAIIDRTCETVHYARAGHPPPLVVGLGGAVWLDGSIGPPLAVPQGARPDAAVYHLTRGDLVVLYSDGLVERPGELFDAGLARLERATLALYGAPVHAVADGLMLELVGDSARDDVVLVVKLLPDPTSDRVTT
jgi:serine phosphatase RsbU (regulator of sigma subunit)